MRYFLFKREYYADQTDFDIKKAVTKENIAQLSLEDIKKLQKDGKVAKNVLLSFRISTPYLRNSPPSVMRE